MGAGVEPVEGGHARCAPRPRGRGPRLRSQAREALEHVVLLAARGFDEAPGSGGAIRPQRGPPRPAGPTRTRRSPPPQGSGSDRRGPGTPHPSRWPTPAPTIPAAEWRRLKEAIAAVRRDVQRVRARAVREIGEAEAAIFDAHLLLLDDADLLDDVRLRVDGGQAAAPAWSAAVHRVGAELGAIPDPYLQARAADVTAVGDQVLRALLGLSGGDAGAHRGAGRRRPHPGRGRRARPLARRRRSSWHSAARPRTARSCCAPGASRRSSAAGPGVLGIADGTLLAVDGTARRDRGRSTAEDVQSSLPGPGRGARRARERQALAHARSPA